jgi:hypothetical protein
MKGKGPLPASIDVRVEDRTEFIFRQQVLVPLDHQENLLDRAPGIRGELAFMATDEGIRFGDEVKGERGSFKLGGVFGLQPDFQIEVELVSLKV